MSRPGIGLITQTPADVSNWVLNCATTGCDKVFRERLHRYESWVNPKTNRINTTCTAIKRTEAYDTAVDELWAVHKKALVCPNCALRLRIGVYRGRRIAADQERK